MLFGAKHQHAFKDHVESEFLNVVQVVHRILAFIDITEQRLVVVIERTVDEHRSFVRGDAPCGHARAGLDGLTPRSDGVIDCFFGLLGGQVRGLQRRQINDILDLRPTLALRSGLALHGFCGFACAS